MVMIRRRCGDCVSGEGRVVRVVVVGAAERVTRYQLGDGNYCRGKRLITVLWHERWK